MLRQQGHLLTRNGDVAGQWKEPCEDFLNPANMSSWKKKQSMKTRGKTHSDTWQSPLNSSPMAGCQGWLTLRCPRLWTVTPFHYRVEVWDRACRVADCCGGSHFKQRGTRGCAQVIRVSHYSVSLEELIRRPTVKPWIQEKRRGFRPGRRMVDRLFSPHVPAGGSLGLCPSGLHMLCESGEGSQPGPLAGSWEMLRKYGAPGPLLGAIFFPV